MSILCTSKLRSPIGPIYIHVKNATIADINFSTTAINGNNISTSPSDEAICAEAKRQLQAYFTGQLQKFTLPLAPFSDNFSGRVWQELLKIPYGSTASYKEIAIKIGQPKAYRAVASACAKNPIAIIIPCHRIIGSNGSLAGYNGGLQKKSWLLSAENQA